MSVTKIHTREELEQKREEYRKALNAQKKQILICGGTGCVAGGSLKIYDRMKELMEEKGIHCAVKLEKEPHGQYRRLKKERLPRLLRDGPAP